MFADACSRTGEFIRPLLVSTRLQDGTVSTSCSTFIILNEDGWVISAGHPFDSFVKFQSDQKKMKEINEINEGRSPDEKVKPDPRSICNHSMWWGGDRVRMTNLYVNRQIDIAIAKLENFDSSKVRDYPVFKDPDHLRPGTSLCRLGFAFLDVPTTFDEAHGSFMIPKIAVEDVVFPNECIHTRTIDRGKSSDGDFPMKYIETSTPGIRGQSGGPIVDTDGRVYAMQVHTVHQPLGFHPAVEYEGQRVVENQFINLGIGVSVETIRAILDKRGIRYSAEGDETGYRIIG